VGVQQQLKHSDFNNNSSTQALRVQQQLKHCEVEGYAHLLLALFTRLLVVHVTFIGFVLVLSFTVILRAQLTWQTTGAGQWRKT